MRLSTNQKLIAAGVLIAGLIAGQELGWIDTAAPPPAPIQHDCSGAMKAAMESNPSLAARRQELCDEGGEARVEAYIEQKQKERAAPAY